MSLTQNITKIAAKKKMNPIQTASNASKLISSADRKHNDNYVKAFVWELRLTIIQYMMQSYMNIVINSSIEQE